MYLRYYQNNLFLVFSYEIWASELKIYSFLLQSKSNVYEYLYKHRGSFGAHEYFLLTEKEKDVKVKKNPYFDYFVYFHS